MRLRILSTAKRLKRPSEYSYINLPRNYIQGVISYFVNTGSITKQPVVIELWSVSKHPIFNVQKQFLTGGKTRLSSFECHHFCKI